MESPRDSYGHLIRLTPTGVAKARTVQALTSSYYIVLNSATTLLRVYAVAKDVYLHWSTGGEDYCTNANFDEMIPAGSYIDLAIPNQTDGSKYDAIQVVGREAGSTVIVIEK
jgi:hypothetical protein